MSTSTYHHGDLRNTLLDAAERIIDADVTRMFSLRELAREAGVSHAAPYKHFATQAELVAELARRWMADFVTAQEAAVSGADARADLLAAGQAYVGWAADHPSRFTIIFDPALNTGTGAGDLAAEATRHEALLRGLVADAIEAAALTGPPEIAALQLWALVHGLATLVILGHVGRADVPAALQRALLPA